MARASVVKMISIYLIENIINGKLYIGKTDLKPQKRWTNHQAEARAGSQTYFHRAIRKYGKDCFKQSVIDVLDTEELANKREVFWIGLFHSHLPDVGYNQTLGGDGMCNPTEEVLQRMIEAGRKHIHHTEETKQRISKAMMGNKKSPETIEKMKLAAVRREENKLFKIVAWG